jgi:hypothetical protein
MHTRLSQFESGWVSISCALTIADIDSLITRLHQLRNQEIGHFHFRTDDFSADSGVADVEFSSAGDDDVKNMIIE